MAKKNKHTIPKETKKFLDIELINCIKDWSFKKDCKDAKKNILADICSEHTNYLIRQLSHKDRLSIGHCWNNIYTYIWKKLEREARKQIKGQFK